MVIATVKQWLSLKMRAISEKSIRMNFMGTFHGHICEEIRKRK